MKHIASFLLAVTVFFQVNLAHAGVPIDWGINFQEAASPSKERVHEFHELMLWIISAIVLVVLALLVYVCIRYRKQANPEPAKFSHNVLVEIIWTAIPVLILIVIAIPSFKLLYYTDRVAEPEMTIKVTGYQWYWGYDYPDHGDISFLSYMLKDDELKEGDVRLLSTDTKVVLPIDTNIQILVTAADVIHSWAVPALGLKKDAMPGRLNETWVNITKPGTYFGQCSEICGKDHAYMPIEIKAVTKEDFAKWVIASGGSMPEPKAPAEPEDSTEDALEENLQSNLERNNEQEDSKG